MLRTWCLWKMVNLPGLGATFTSNISQAIDCFFPERTVKLHHTDKPWMTASLKHLILQRQAAYHSGHLHLWRFYRDKVRTSITQRKEQFYSEKIQYLKTTDSRKWWNYVNKVSGRSCSSVTSTNCFVIDGVTKSLTSSNELVNNLNKFFLSVNEDIPPLDLCQLLAYLPCSERAPFISLPQVCQKLLKLNPSKATGPDNISARILREFAFEFAGPVANLFNSSLVSGIVPDIWKAANITPVPKESAPRSLSDFRPTLLTPCLSKVLEEFVACWVL